MNKVVLSVVLVSLSLIPGLVLAQGSEASSLEAARTASRAVPQGTSAHGEGKRVQEGATAQQKRGAKQEKRGNRGSAGGQMDRADQNQVDRMCQRESERAESAFSTEMDSARPVHRSRQLAHSAAKNHHASSQGQREKGKRAAKSGG